MGAISLPRKDDSSLSSWFGNLVAKDALGVMTQGKSVSVSRIVKLETEGWQLNPAGARGGVFLGRGGPGSAPQILRVIPMFGA